ncbi:MAG: hypothetical protein BGN96_08720 [Bacteroidales bacterium 45-6]|nr:MAG: hypothetical protein BGN96_08720 [Bacteroidales bacterium 45-6]
MNYSQKFLFPILLVVTLLSTAITSCKRTTKETVKQSARTLVYDSLVVNKSIALTNDTSGPVNKLAIHFVFPSSIKGDSMLLQSVQKQFVEALFGAEYAHFKPQEATDNFYKKYEEDYLATASDYNKAKAQGFEMQSWGNTFQTMRTDTLPSSKPDTLSFCAYVENYNGGAHGSHHTGYYNIDLKTGKPIKESDIFKPGYEAELKKAIIHQLLAVNKLTRPEELIEKGFFDLNDLKPNNNFLITKDGITYGFNEYEIAPYYMGLIKVHIASSSISNILKR